MKHGNSFYLELSREIFTEKYNNLSIGAKWLFVILNELEQRFSGKHEECFFRSDEQLAADMGVSIKTLQKYKSELRNTDLIEVSMGHFIDPQTGKRSEKHFTFYKILK